MRRGATHRRVERRRANRNGERQAPSADAVRARTAANLRTAFRPPPLQRLARRRSPHTRQTPFQREPLRTCERHSAASAATFVAPAFAAYAADAVPARAAANLRTAFRPPPLQRLARRRSPHTRQTPFLREPLRTCERHSAASAATLVAPAFTAYARRRAAGHVTEHETARGRRRRRQARRGRSPFSCRRPLDRATSRRE
ncbi:hypothetical protein DO62_5219 [Burkholderia pseudomallei]|nr:hypothetical protein DO62_5219 [Burkholderia pseudomallei]